MNRITSKFNPAALPAEFMKGLKVAEETANTPAAAKRFLLPGQMFVSPEATTVTTILGSCVAICLWSPRTGIGGMNHYLLPEGSATEINRLRYGNNANPALLYELIALGCDPRELQAKVFGGATMMTGMDPATSLGKRNMELALDFLKTHRITLVAKHLSEQRGCKLIFQTNDGTTQLRTFEDK
jgi:chemotaxis protein CheD